MDPLNNSALTPEQAQACNEFVRATLSRLKTEAGVHAETAIASAARMAGMYLLNSFKLPIAGRESGTALVSQQADTEGPALIATLFATLTAHDIGIDPSRVPTRIPDEHEPQLMLLQSQLMFGVPFRNTVRKFALSDRDAAFACIVAAATIIRDCASVLDPHVAVAIARWSCVEATKTVPISIPGGDAGTGDRKPWYRFW